MTQGDILLSILQTHPLGLSEYELLKTLEKHHPNFFEELPNPSTLYQRHFLLFHHLYLMQRDWINNIGFLNISALKIRLLPLNENDKQNQVGEHHPLVDFYCDKQHLWLSEQDVIKMQQSFWEKFLAIDQKTAALKTLQLVDEDTINKKSIKRQFKRLSQKYHPDKGGNEEDFNTIKQAYDQLISIY